MKGKYLIAGILIFIGLGLLIEQFTYFSFGNIIGTWWPLIIVAVGLSQLMNNKNSIFSASLLLLIGVLLQANELEILPGGFWGTFWPLMFILIGVWMIVGKKRNISVFSSSKRILSDDEVNIHSVFSGFKQRFTTSQFRGGSINVAFGGAEVDLRDSVLAPGDNVLDITTAFGGTEIWVPRNWNISYNGSPFFGALENKTFQDLSNSNPNSKLIIRYSVAFGGIEIRN